MSGPIFRALAILVGAMLLLPFAAAAQDLGAAPSPSDVIYPRIARWAGRNPDIAALATPQPKLEEISPSTRLLTIDELEQMALSRNPTVAQAVRQIEALQGKQLQQGLLPNPTISYIGEEIGDEGRAGLQGFLVGQAVVTAGKLGLNRAVVSHEIQQAQHSLEIQQVRVINDVRTAAYELLATQRTIALMEQLVRIGQEGQDVAEELLKAREVSQVDLLQARIEANSARVLLANAQNDYQAAWRKMASVVGVPDLNPAPLRDDLSLNAPDLNWEESFARLLSASPELGRAAAGVERARSALARQCAGRIPNFELLASSHYNSVSEDVVAGVGVAVPLQIFDRNQGNVQRAQAELAAAHQELQRVELALQQRLASVFRNYANARQQVKQYESLLLPDAKESLELIQQGYRQGEFGYLELLTGQRTFFRVNLAYVTALQDLWVSSTRIEGLLLSGALQAPGT